MSNSANGRKKKKDMLYIFRGKSKKTSKSQGRKLFEAILMLGLGINLMFFLNTLPRNFSLNAFLVSAWSDFSIAFMQLINSIAKFGGVFIVFTLLLLSIILVVGGLWRLYMFFSFKNQPSKNKKLK